MKKVKINAVFELSRGKFNHSEYYDEYCMICEDEDTLGKKCYYLSQSKVEGILIQVCPGCFKKLNVIEKYINKRRIKR